MTRSTKSSASWWRRASKLCKDFSKEKNMKDYKLVRLREHPELKDQAAAWFASKWGIPLEAYQDSMEACLKQPNGVPQWYLVQTNSGITVGGLGMIENDFHKRPDLTPNVCAVFVEPEFRLRGIAHAMLDAVRADAAGLGIQTLYLLTDHTDFYERCGWTFHCMVENEDGSMSRMYRAEME